MWCSYKIKEIIYYQAEASRLRYEKLWNGLLHCHFVTNKVDPCLFMSKTVVGVVYVGDSIFWERSKYDIDNLINSLKEDGPSYNWE